MQAEKIVLTMAKKHPKDGGNYWYSKPGAIRFTQHDILAQMRAGIEFEFNKGNEDKELLGVLALAEKGVSSNAAIDFTRKGDTALLNRIIRAGGFMEYIEKLENLKNE
jgi:hypothetical protein